MTLAATEMGEAPDPGVPLLDCAEVIAQRMALVLERLELSPLNTSKVIEATTRLLL